MYPFMKVMLTLVTALTPACQVVIPVQSAQEEHGGGLRSQDGAGPATSDPCEPLVLPRNCALPSGETRDLDQGPLSIMDRAHSQSVTEGPWIFAPVMNVPASTPASSADAKDGLFVLLRAFLSTPSGPWVLVVVGGFGCVAFLWRRSKPGVNRSLTVSSREEPAHEDPSIAGKA